MEKDPESYNVRAVERAMQILSSFDGEHADRGVSEIAQTTGLHKATTHRIMMTLLNGGFLERAPDGERFRLGIRVVELGLGALRGLDLRQAAFPYMQQLVERFNETCDLGIFFIGVGVSWWVRIQARSVDCTAVGIRRKVLVEVACCKMEGLRSGLSLGESQTYEEERNETEIYRRRELLIPEHQAR